METHQLLRSTQRASMLEHHSSTFKCTCMCACGNIDTRSVSVSDASDCSHPCKGNFSKVTACSVSAIAMNSAHEPHKMQEDTQPIGSNEYVLFEEVICTLPLGQQLFQRTQCAAAVVLWPQQVTTSTTHHVQSRTKQQLSALEMLADVATGELSDPPARSGIYHSRSTRKLYT